MHVIISNTLCIHLTLVYRVFYVPGIICRVSLASPTPIQLMGEMLILYLAMFFKLVIMVEFAVTLHWSSAQLKSVRFVEYILIV